jgi:tetratricopeptide (TPR) repeat protein
MSALTLIFALTLVAVVSLGCSEAGPTKDQLLSRATEAFAVEQYDKAELDYREVLRLAPNDPMALSQLGIIYFDQGQIIQAYPLLKQALDLRPDEPALQLKLAQAALALGQLMQARDLAQQVLEKKPGDETALLLLVDTATTTDDIKETQQLIEGLRGRDRDRASYHLVLGILDFRLTNNARAESEFKAALELDPKSSGAYSALGRLYWSRNDLDAADQAMKTAADLSPLRSPMQMRYVDFKLRYGAVSEAQAIVESIHAKYPDYLPPRVFLMKMACAKQYAGEDCAARVQDILAQDPINFDALFQDSVLKLIKGDVANAILQLEALENAYREQPKLLYQLAMAYLVLAGRAGPVEARDAVDKAASRLNEAIRLDPHFEDAILKYAELQIRSGNAAVVIDPLVRLIGERPQIAEAHYLLAAAYRSTQQDNEALAVLRTMADLFPKNPQPAFGAGSILLAQGQKAEARKELERSVEISPEYLPPTEALVNLDLSEKQYAAALDRVQKQIDKNATLAQLWGLRAKVYWAQHDAPRAETDLSRAIKLDPTLEPAYLLLAQIYMSSNRTEQAIETLNGFIEMNKTVPALLQLAKIYEQAKNFPAARDAYEKLLTVSESYTPALNNLAVLYSEHLGQIDKASEIARKARDLAPDEPHLADTLGWILFKKGDYGNALPLLVESASKLPDNLEIQFHAGMGHYMVGAEEPARLALQKVAGADTFPAVDEARRRLAVLAIPSDGADPTVRSALENYLRKWPNDPAALMRLAHVQQREGAEDQAIKTFEKIAADHPFFAPATRQLALIYGQDSTHAIKAYEFATKARQSYPDDPEIAKTLGILNYGRGYFPRSAELLEEAARKRKEDPEIHYYLGAAHQQLKQWDECKTALEITLKLSPSSGLAVRAKQALAQCTEGRP